MGEMTIEQKEIYLKLDDAHKIIQGIFKGDKNVSNDIDNFKEKYN